MDDTLDVRVFLKHLLCSLLVTEVNLLKGRTDACDFLNTVEHFLIGVRQIVYYNYLVACLLQFNCGMRADKASTSCYQNCLFHIV